MSLFEAIEKTKDLAHMQSLFKNPAQFSVEGFEHFELQEIKVVREYSGTTLTDVSIPYKEAVILYELLATNEEGDVPLKIYGYTSSNGSKEKVYKTLHYLKKYFSHSNSLGILQPIAYIAELGLFLAGEVKGTSLKDIALMGDDSKNVVRYFGLAGKWLKHLHEFPYSEYDFDFLRPKKTRNVEANSGKKRSFESMMPEKRDEIMHLENTIKKTYKNLSEQSEMVLIHGDYHQDNIYCDGSDITVIDFEWSHIDVPEYDLAGFCSHMEIILMPNIPKLKFESYLQAFLDEYWGSTTSRGNSVQRKRFHIAMAMSYFRSFAHFIGEYEKTKMPNEKTGADYALMNSKKHLNIASRIS